MAKRFEIPEGAIVLPLLLIAGAVLVTVLALGSLLRGRA